MTKVEIRISSGLDYINVIRDSGLPGAESAFKDFVTNSEQVFTVLLNGEVIAVWGVILPSLLSGEGYLWLQPTEVVDEHRFVLVRHSQRVIEALLKTYSAIIGDCLVSDLRAQKWLRLLGAKFGFPTTHTIPFRIERK